MHDSKWKTISMGWIRRSQKGLMLKLKLEGEFLFSYCKARCSVSVAKQLDEGTDQARAIRSLLYWSSWQLYSILPIDPAVTSPFHLTFMIFKAEYTRSFSCVPIVLGFLLFMLLLGITDHWKITVYLKESWPSCPISPSRPVFWVSGVCLP